MSYSFFLSHALLVRSIGSGSMHSYCQMIFAFLVFYLVQLLFQLSRSFNFAELLDSVVPRVGQ